MSNSATIKARIKAVLLELVDDEVLAEVIVDDFTFDPTQRDVGAYPVAIVTTPAIRSYAETNRDNMRTYEYRITVIQKAENVTGEAAIEDLVEAILDKFDNDPTLDGTANGAIDPSTSEIQALVTPDKTWLWFDVMIRAKALTTLTY